MLLLLACMPGSAQTLDFALRAWGPENVVAGHFMFFNLTGEVISGANDQMVTPYISGLPPGATVHFVNMERFCCGTKLWRVDSTTPVKIQTDAQTPPGLYPLIISYRTDSGIERVTTYPLNVLSEPGPVMSGPFPPNLTLPSLSKWEQDMLTYGQKHCTESEAALWEGFPWYYDGERVYYQIADYTGDGSWNLCAKLQESVYRPYVISNGGGVPGYRIFPHGLAMDYERTADVLSYDAIELLYSGNAWSSVANLSYDIGWEASREIAYALNVHVVHERIGGRRDQNMQVLAEVAIGHFDQWFVSGKAAYVQPFMVALSAEALIGYYDLTKDNRVPPLLKLAADRLWAKSWDPSTQSFWYQNNDGTSSPAPDLNLLIAPLYGWVYKQSADAAYRTMGDAIFTGGVQGAWLVGGKQFSQNYRWSFDYLKWRSASSTGDPAARPAANQPPAAAITATSTSGQAPLVVAFSGTGSADPDGTIQTYAWNFGDGGTATGGAVSYTYTRGGTYTAVLTVTDNQGATGSAQVVIVVSTPPPMISVMQPQGGSYSNSSTILITAAVEVDGKPASGVTVVFSIMKPGTLATTSKTVKTGSGGIAAWSYQAPPSDPAGEYTVTATATNGSQSVSSRPLDAYFSLRQPASLVRAPRFARHLRVVTQPATQPQLSMAEIFRGRDVLNADGRSR